MATAEINTTGAALQTYVSLAKNAKGKAAAAVIQQALSAPNVYVFGELMEMPGVQGLTGTEDAPYFELLKIFAYGSYADYKSKVSQLPQLSKMQQRKLQQLSIVSLAATSKVIPYSVLQRDLDIQELRELEDLIIDSIYQGLIHGKLDQKQKTFEVEYAMGRDLKPESVEEFISILSNWSNQSEVLLKSIREKIQHANMMSEQEKKHKEEYEKRVENVKSSIKAAMESENMHLMQAAEFESSDFFGNKRGSNKTKGHRDPHPPQHRDRRGL